jgi:ERCC4-type nuclease
MSIDLSLLTIHVTKPNSKPALMLAEKGVNIVPIPEEEDSKVDRYIISSRISIERRTGSSFLTGIVDKSVYTSAIYLKENFQIPILFIEGEVSYECSMFNPQAVRGAISSMMLLYGLNVLSTIDMEDTVEMITMIARQEQIGIKEISLIPKRKAMDLPDMQRRVIEMLPGCGMVTARDLLQYYGSVKRIVNLNEEDFRLVPGVGEKKASEMYKVLNAEYEAVDTEKNLEDVIEISPNILFEPPIQLISRQHYIFTDGKERHIVDMVFFDPDENELILVELKRGKLVKDHLDQIQRYLYNAPKSDLLRSYLEKGASIRGILATVEKCKLEPDDSSVSVCIVDKDKVIKVLKDLREKRFDIQGLEKELKVEI